MNVLAFSGGWDSTACALRLWQLGEQFTMLFTPTGNELQSVLDHIARVQLITGAKLVTPPNRSLADWINEFDALPNWRQRWCTRLIKIVPCIAWLKQNPGCTLMVGLRADEDDRVGLYGDWATYRYPLREWGWNREQVVRFCKEAGVIPPDRTDCALCYGQRISEWYALWQEHKDKWAEGEAWEAKTGHTFRSAQRDTWPAAMKDLRTEFETGRKPRGLPVLNNEYKACRVCSM